MSNYVNVTQSGMVKSHFGKLKAVVVNSHTNGTLKLWDSGNTSSEPVQATAVLTSSGASAPATHAVSEIVSSGASVAATHAVNVFTSTGVVVAGQTITIGTTVYTATASTPNAPYQVYMGANAQAFLLNLKYAINGTTAYRGTSYGYGTDAHASVVASASDATTLTVRGRVPGTSLNALATTETFTNGSWADTTLGGGTGASDAGVTTAAATITIGDTVYTVVDELSENYGASARAYQVKKGASEATLLDNLKLAINATGTAGTNYSTGTAAHPTVVATTNTNTVQTVRSRTPGTDNNTVATTTTLANYAWADTTLGGGTGNSDAGITTDDALITVGNRTYTAVVELSESLGADAIADQVLWETSEAVFLDNFKKAVNASGTEGTHYSTGTTQHFQVTATTNTDTEQTLVAREGGTASNALATTTTLANYAFGDATMTGGTGGTSRVMFNTITFGATEREVDLGNVAFDEGLYATVGGTADLTFIID